jgi:hypothetical protein
MMMPLAYVDKIMNSWGYSLLPCLTQNDNLRRAAQRLGQPRRRKTDNFLGKPD